MKKTVFPLLIFLLLLAAGCQDKPAAESSLDEQLREIISANELTGDPSL
jgi:hypothetical protein